MKLTLRKIGQLQLEKSHREAEREGLVSLRVLYCAICRTDVKMWSEGHRDLSFPRVLGHELVARDDKGSIYTVWPGKVCGNCYYCAKGKINLCENIKIMGFHYDGGFGEYILAPKNSLVPVPHSLPTHLACFAEPVGCTIHALKKLSLLEGDKIIIYGGGTMGLISALVSKARGAVPIVIEKSEEKIKKAEIFLKKAKITCHKETTFTRFQASLNACPDLHAFAQCVLKLEKGGRMAFFSGLTKNEKLETNLINLVHYCEGELYGSYGLTKQDMSDALDIIRKNIDLFEELIEDIVPAPEALDIFPKILSSNPLKYILDLSDWATRHSPHPTGSSQLSTSREDSRKEFIDYFREPYKSTLMSIDFPAKDILPAAQAKIDNKTKPLNSLGRLEDLAIKICLIQGTLNPAVQKKFLFVFAGDHGVVEEGVSAYPAEVTPQMVINFLNGGAAINVLCRHHGINMKVVDMGVNADFEDHPLLVKLKVRKGTRNFALQEAMNHDEAICALQNGMEAFVQEYESGRIDIVGLGDMGIGNTTSSSAIISAVTGLSPIQVTGRGTGIDDGVMKHKAQVIEKALLFHSPDPQNGLEVLQKLGGYEIAGIAGATLAAASKRVAVVLDGVISTAGGLIAFLINPAVKDYIISAHRSVEPAQKAALEYMGIEQPVLDLGMRLGEGTGAALAINLVEAAAKIMTQMASFEEAGVSKSTKD